MTNRSNATGVERGRYPSIDALADELRLAGADLRFEDMADSLQALAQAERSRNPLRTPFNLIVLAHVHAGAELLQNDFGGKHAQWQSDAAAFEQELSSRSFLKRQVYHHQHERPREPQDPRGWINEEDLELERKRPAEVYTALRALSAAGLLEQKGPRGYEDYRNSYRVTELGKALLQQADQPEYLPVQNGSTR